MEPGAAAAMQGQGQGQGQVRVAVADDAPALALLCQAHAAYEGIAYQPHGHAQRLRAALQHEQVHLWLALRDAQAVGYAAATRDFSTLAGQAFMHLDCLYLEPAARGQSLGQALMDAVRQHGRAQGCCTLQWQTPVWNDAAIRFYDRQGATRLQKQRFTLAL